MIRELWLTVRPVRLIQGIMTRQSSEDILRGQSLGCFMIRFSESQVGHLSIDYIAATEAPIYQHLLGKLLELPSIYFLSILFIVFSVFCMLCLFCCFLFVLVECISESAFKIFLTSGSKIFHSLSEVVLKLKPLVNLFPSFPKENLFV